MYGSYLTWLEQNNRLQTGKLSGINSQGLEAVEDVSQAVQVRCGSPGLGVLRGGTFRKTEKRTLVHGQRPLDSAEQKHLTPGLLQ